MSHYTFKAPCSSCGAVPSYTGHLMCDACVSGEEHMNDWVTVLKEGGYVELPEGKLYLEVSSPKLFIGKVRGKKTFISGESLSEREKKDLSRHFKSDAWK